MDETFTGLPFAPRAWQTSLTTRRGLAPLDVERDASLSPRQTAAFAPGQVGGFVRLMGHSRR
jgi:hypothetical protein